MSRQPRIEVADAIFHVIARGNERRPIFHDDMDRARFLEILAGVRQRYAWRVLCYCLMGNHYHLIARTVRPNLAQGMRQLNGVYAQWFNRRHSRVGHLFQGRYKAVLIQADQHLEGAVRYVLRNPIRAGIAHRVDDWRWTSHAATVAATSAPALPVIELLSYLGTDPAAARRRYLDLISHESPPFASQRHPLIEGDDPFIEAHLAAIRASPEHPRASLLPPRPTLAELVATTDDTAGIARAHAEYGFSMRQLATHLGCGVSTIHRRIRAHEADTQDRTPVPAGATCPTHPRRQPDERAVKNGRPDPVSTLRPGPDMDIPATLRMVE